MIRIGFLQADFKWLLSGLFPYAEDISAQINHGAVHSIIQKIVLQTVRNIPLRNGAQFNGCIRRKEGEFISIQLKILVSHFFYRIFQRRLVRYPVFIARKIP